MNTYFKSEEVWEVLRSGRERSQKGSSERIPGPNPNKPDRIRQVQHLGNGNGGEWSEMRGKGFSSQKRRYEVQTGEILGENVGEH